MTQHEITKAYHRIIGSLANKEIKNSLEFLQDLVSGTRSYTFQDKLDELKNTYKYMLSYFIDGMEDPMQHKIYADIQIQLYELTDKIQNDLLLADSLLSYYRTRRQMQVSLLPYEQLKGRIRIDYELKNYARFDEGLRTLFDRVWTSDFLSSADAQNVNELLMDNRLPSLVGSQLVSALFLGLQQMFDIEKLQLLFDAAFSEDEQVRIRAFIVILLVLYLYRERLFLYPQIKERLDALSEAPDFIRIVQTIILRFILSRETEKITRKLQDEIIPEMMKMAPKISNKINLSELTPDLQGDEMNPEWKDLISGTNLEKKMEEFSELQQEGADVMHSTFVHLKSFPFFNDVANWFLPFYPQQPSLKPLFGNETEQQGLESMMKAPFMCNSDKYSLCFSILQMPEIHRNTMVRQIDSQFTEALQQSEDELVSKKQTNEQIIGQYIQDLYRFFKLYPYRYEFEDIFTLGLDFHHLPILAPYLKDEEVLLTIAEYYLRKNYFVDALSIYNQLEMHDQGNEVILQKIGYCKQMNGDLQGALDTYLKADLLNADSKWLTRRIANCYRSLKKPEEALVYYRRLEALLPNDLAIQLSIGHCYLELRNFTEALKCYYKVDYLDTKSHKAWRPIAWCSFLTGKFDQARHYYRQIVEDKPMAQDYMNAGHTEWILQNIKGALDLYKKAVELDDNDFFKFSGQFNQDISELLIAGIESDEIPLVLDQLRYLLDE